MKIAIIALTRGSMNLGLKLYDLLENRDLYIPEKFKAEKTETDMIIYSDGVKALTERIFNQYQCLLYILATGIVVRCIAPHISKKQMDPAVIVVDEKGKNVISLLSGHLGGANEYTINIANLIQANPVITTASDINETIAVDTLAMALNCEIEDYYDATKVTAHIVNGERVSIISSIPLDLKLPDNVESINSIKTPKAGNKGLIFITEREDFPKADCDTVVLRPKNIILGIGCRRGATKENILRIIENVLIDNRLSTKSIKHIATIDIKKNEPGLCHAAQVLGVPVLTVSKNDIIGIEHEFNCSDFVKKAIGVGAVCEPAALLTSKNGEIIVEKKKSKGVTVAVVREGGF